MLYEVITQIVAAPKSQQWRNAYRAACNKLRRNMILRRLQLQPQLANFWLEILRIRSMRSLQQVDGRLIAQLLQHKVAQTIGQWCTLDEMVAISYNFV